MSDKTKRPYAIVKPIGGQIVHRLGLACTRVEIAGSLRRQCPLIGDIEIVAIPRFRQRTMFAMPSQASMVDDLLDAWQVRVGAGHFRMGPNGQKLKRFWLTTKCGEEYQVDLFLQPDPATWGVNFLLRTGSAAFSKDMVTPKSKGGLMPSHLYVSGARVWGDNEGRAYETPEEEDVFKLYGMPFIPPEERN